MGVNWMKDVLTPVAGGTAGFVAARVLSNGLANVEPVRNILDKGVPAADAGNTKIAANVLGIIATLGLATRVPLIRRRRVVGYSLIVDHGPIESLFRLAGSRLAPPAVAAPFCGRWTG